MLLMIPSLLPDDISWIDEDNFTNNPEKDPRKKPMMDELKEVKKTIKADLDSTVDLKMADVLNQVGGAKVRISKLRLIIELDVYIAYNLNKTTGIKYVVARTNWLDKNGKKYRKFSRNLGAEDKVLVNGKIPTRLMETTENELLNMMWQEYKSEYKPYMK